MNSSFIDRFQFLVSFFLKVSEDESTAVVSLRDKSNSDATPPAISFDLESQSIKAEISVDDQFMQLEPEKTVLSSDGSVLYLTFVSYFLLLHDSGNFISLTISHFYYPHISVELIIRYFHGRCSQEIRDIIQVPLRRVRTTRSSTHLHPFQVSLPTARTLSHKSSFIPRTCNLWNVLPSSCFPESYNLPSFKSKINKLDLISLSS